MKALWNNQIVAESDETIIVDRNHYFPPDSIKAEFFTESEQRSKCFWKGEAKYKHLIVNGEINKDAAWYYSEPKPIAENIKAYIAFWRGVEVFE